MAEVTNPVIIYSTTWCGYCGMLKKYLDDKGVAWVEKDIEKERDSYQELMEKMQGSVRGVPVSDIHGTMVTGFDRPAIDAALAK